MFKKAICTICLLGMAVGFWGCDAADEELSVVNGPGHNGIVGGEETNYEEWKGVIALYYSLGGAGALCSGTLIDPKVIITAGHCVFGDGVDAVASPQNLSIFGGPNVQSASRITYPGVERVVAHPDWSGGLGMTDVDLAMVLLKAPIQGIETYGIRDMPKVKVGNEGMIVGYGLDSSDGSGVAGIHRKGETTVLSVGTSNMMLGNPAGTCQGDSGGPFFTEQDGKQVVTAVTSFGVSQECRPSGGGFSANVLTHREWIEETMIDFVGHDLNGVPVETEGTDEGTDNDVDTSSEQESDTGTEEDSTDDGDDGDGGDDGGCSFAHQHFHGGLIQLLDVIF